MNLYYNLLQIIVDNDMNTVSESLSTSSKKVFPGILAVVGHPRSQHWSATLVLLCPLRSLAIWATFPSVNGGLISSNNDQLSGFRFGTMGIGFRVFGLRAFYHAYRCPYAQDTTSPRALQLKIFPATAERACSSRAVRRKRQQASGAAARRNGGAYIRKHHHLIAKLCTCFLGSVLKGLAMQSSWGSNIF